MPLPLPKPTTNQPFPPLTIHPTALLSPQTSFIGTHAVTIEEGAVVQLRAKFVSYFGGVSVGPNTLISEKSCLGPLTHPTIPDGDAHARSPSNAVPVAAGLGTRLERGVVVETRAIVEAEFVGEGTVVGVGSRLGVGSWVGKYCKICAMCTVAPAEVIPDFTVVWGDGQRRTERKGLEGFRTKGVESQREVVGELMVAAGK